MIWTTVRDLKAQLSRHWERGNLLRPLAGGESCFPLRLVLKRPGSAELTAEFEAVRDWIAQLKTAQFIRIEWRDVRHPVMGTQRLPQSAWIDSPDQAVAWLTKRAEMEQFKEITEQTRYRCPVLLEWLARSPLQALDLAEHWTLLLDVVEWIQQHPQPRCYLRQVDLPGIHTKFIETHKAVLIQLLDRVLPPGRIIQEYRGINGFTSRYGFIDKPVRIRFRVLDKNIDFPPGTEHSDVTLDSGSFARLNIPVQRVFITENEINFLAFPPTREAIVIFGEGYGWDALAQAHWLERRSLYYWGDIDTNGFAILDQLRKKFSGVKSFLMDKETLMQHQKSWATEQKQKTHGLPTLTETERKLYDDLRDNRIREKLRLEQELIGFNWLQKALAES
jgi:hypothetical protein